MFDVEQEIERRLARAVAEWQKTVTAAGPATEVDAAWLQTPEHLRMAFGVLQAAGVPPREVELLQQRAALRAQLEQAAEPARQRALRQQLSALEQALALRLEGLQRC